MNAKITYKRTNELYRTLVKQFFKRVVGTYLLLQLLGVVISFLVSALVIYELYRCFSSLGFEGRGYHIWVSIPIVLISVLGLIRVIKRAVKFKRSYDRLMSESCLVNKDEAVERELVIDDVGVAYREAGENSKQLKWDDMKFALSTKDFYIFADKGFKEFVGIPNNAVDATLGEYLTSKMKIIKKQR